MINPLSHSAAQNFHLVQVFLNSSLCLLHFTNYISNSDSILFRSVVKRTFYISDATPSQRSKKNYCHSFWNKNTYASQLAPLIFFPAPQMSPDFADNNCSSKKMRQILSLITYPSFMTYKF
jgi:hypothetical protein